jgi:uncharacterized protein (TIGR03067 family)
LSELEDRPTDFAAPADSRLLLVVWKRSPSAAGDRAKAIAEELQKFAATWRFVAVEVEGTKIPDKAFENDTLTLTGKTFTSFVEGHTTHGVFKIDPSVKPKTIDLTFTDGPGKGQTQIGIYELDGETQKICFAKPGQPRPTEFATKPGNGQMIQVLKRK